MRAQQLILFILSFVIVFSSHAGDLTLEPHAMLYYRIPLGGGGKQQTTHTFGFRIDRALVERGKPIDYRHLLQQPAIMDLKLNHYGVESLAIAGVDYLKQYRELHAAEDNGAAAEAPAAEGDAAPAGEETANAEAAAGEESTATEASTEEEEDKGFLPSYSDLFKENQNLGLIIGALLLAGFVMGGD